MGEKPPEEEEINQKGEGEEEIIPIELQPWSDFTFFNQKTKEEGDFWKDYTPHQLGIIFSNGPIELLHRAWGRLQRGITITFDNDNPQLNKLNHWDPFELKNEGKRLYHSYSPVILDTKSDNFEVLAFFPPRHNRKQIQGCWYTMPSLAFLPIGVKRVIGGDGGLLICDGGMLWTGVLEEESGELSPLTARPPLVFGGRPVPIEAEKWLRDNYLPGQSILLICNPITQEFMYFPPFVRTMSLNAKAACIRYLDFAELRPPTPPPEEFISDEEDPSAILPSESIEEIVKKASRRGTILEKELSRKMSIPFAKIERRKSTHANLDDELDELDAENEMKKGQRPSRRRSSTHASDDINIPQEVENFIEGRFQRLWRLYFECFGRIPIVTPPPTRHYIVLIMGYQQEMKFDGYELNRIVCCVYNSKEQDKWSYIRPIPCPSKTMLNNVGRTSLALLTSLVNKDWMAVCFGAIVLGNIKEALEKEERQYRALGKDEKVCNDLTENPSIFFISMVPDDDTALVFPFHPDGYEENELGCPVVLQPFGVKSPEIIVAVTRKPYYANRLIIFQIDIEHDRFSDNPKPTGTFSWIAETPPCVYHNLFYTEEFTNKPFESCAGNGLISIKSTDGQRLGIYDMYTTRWWVEDFHKFRPIRRKQKPFQLLDVSSWEPNFRQRVEFDSMYVGGRVDVDLALEDENENKDVKDAPTVDAKAAKK